MGQVNEFASEDVEKILLGNKCDLVEQSEVEKEQGEIEAETYDMGFFETSAQTGQGVNEAFEYIVRQIIKQQEERKARESYRAQ